MTTDAAAPVPPRLRWRRRIAWTAGALALLVVLLLVAAGSGAWWALRSDGGTAWLLSRIPGLQVQGGKGTLWGDFDAARIEFALPGGGSVVLADAGWRGLRVEHAPWMAYQARVVMNELHARRVDVVLPAAGARKEEPPRPPQSLRLPVELEVGALNAGEVHLAALGQTPLRDVRARLHLGAGHGTLHEVQALALAWGTLQADASARIAADPPYALAVQARAAQPATGKAPPWRADASLDGPLAQPVVAARLRVQPDGTAAPARPEQALDLRAGLRPFDAWPLGELQASTQALDLSALVPAAPVTSLSGEASAQTSGLAEPATLRLRLANAEAGRWNEGRLPVRTLAAETHVRPDDPRTVDVTQLAAELGSAASEGGRLEARGRWTPATWSLDATLRGLQPAQLDARAPVMVLSGPIKAAGRDFDRGLDQAGVDLQAELAGQFAGRGPARAATLKVDASASMARIEVREARAAAGGAQATLAGVAQHRAADAPWQVKGRATLVDFDPAPWWPGREDTPWRRGPNWLNAQADVDIGAAAGDPHASAWDRVNALRGQAHVAFTRSVLAGVPLEGEGALHNADGAAQVTLKLDAAGNRIDAEGRLGTSRGAADAWKATLAAPALEKLAPLWRLGPSPAGEETLAGALNGQMTLSGRWPALATDGHLEAGALRIGSTHVEHAQARWQVDARSGRDAKVDVQATAAQIAFSQALFKGAPPIESMQAQVQGTMREHRIELRAETKALPPTWTDAFQPPPAAATPAGGTTPPPTAHSIFALAASGGAVPGARDAGLPWSGWRGHLQQLELRSTAPRTVPWVSTRDIDVEVQWVAPLRVAVQPGHAEVLGAVLRWDRVAWQAGAGTQPAQIEAQASLEPLTLSPVLARLQPGFGWGGDLAVAGHLRVRSAPTFTADVVLERQRGDLTVTDETGNTQPLGLTDLRVGLDVQNGTWSFTQGLAGTTLGVAAGAFVARTSPQAAWPSADTPVQGVLEVQVANLGTWGPWLPPGWRLTGELRTSAGIGGRFGAPEYTGQMRGSGIGVRNFLLGVNVTDGDVDIALQGTTARIRRFSAHGGTGTVTLDGNATFGAAPKAVLKLQADRFQLLGRVDRRIVTSGQAQLLLDAQDLTLDGRFAVDEGLIDFTRSDAPQLSNDVVVVRRSGPAPGEEAEGTANANPAPGRQVKLNLDVALGEHLRLKGRGLDTGLRGELNLASPGSHLAVNGTVRAVDGTYAAYGQKLVVDRGQIIFNGPVENPRLDIEATRPNLDVRVGVLVSGTALDPRVRLFSEPDMTEIDKLSWLVLGRGGDTLGRTDTALLERAALALLAGDSESKSDQFTHSLGLDELSVRQSDTGEVHETIVSLGKQISQRWYVGYERSLNATAGSWQLIYRIAQRFTLRAQAGADSSVDLIWTWRWQ
jgi:translocation and assembly module TamB